MNPGLLTACILELRGNILRLDGVSPSEINSRYCNLFAARVCRRLKLSIREHVVWFSQLDHDFWAAFRRDSALCDHMVIEVDGRYYDAECPEGVDSIQEIPAWKFRADRERYSAMKGQLLPDLTPETH
jgi:hypothetical protein